MVLKQLIGYSLLSAMTLIVISIMKYYRVKSSTKNMPGPELFSIDFKRGPNQFYRKRPSSDTLHKIYGPVILNWRGVTPVIEISCAELAQRLYRSSLVLEDKPPSCDEGRYLKYGRRRWVTPGVELNSLNILIPTCLRVGEDLVDALYKMEDNTEIHHIISIYAVDLMFGIALGIDIHERDNARRDAENFLTVLESLEPSNCFLTKIIGHIFTIPNDITLLEATEELDTFLEYNIRAKELELPKRNTFLELLIDHESNLNTHELCNKVREFIFQGLIALPWSITWTLYELGLNLKDQDIVEAEVGEVWPKDRRPDLNDFQQMEYLGLVVRETLRLHPIVSAMYFRVMRNFSLGNYVAPAGTKIRLNIAVLQRDRNVFADPDIFQPKRFSKNHDMMNLSYSYLPFGGPIFSCSESYWNEVVTKVIVSSILKHYHVITEKPISDNVKDITFIFKPRRADVVTEQP